MDYKGKFEEFLDKMTGLLNDAKKKGHIIVRVEDLENAFPELKEESEDEKTERILHSISSKMSLHLRDIFTEEEFQCFDAWSNDRLEKQGERKPTIEIKSAKESLGIDSETYNKIVDECIYGEQKHDDKVEPKFEVGNIITNGKIICKVDENENNKYHGWFGYNKDFSVHYSDIPDIENWHKWTIKDAKDGDVLTNGDFPCIFKRCDDNGSLYVYCGINAHNDFSILSEDPENVWDDYSKQYFPATKEQRYTLFAKMKESGYEWLEETKELKKIEQESAEWNEEDETNSYHLKTLLENLAKDNEHEFRVISDNDRDKYTDWLKSLKQRIGG